jgi:DNA repair protein RecO (recombination protein O)
MTASGKTRFDNQPAFVLHSYPFRETSLVAEVFTRAHGRMGLVARGARRPRSALRGLLLAFQPLQLSWSGKTELRTLMRAEWVGGVPQLSGLSLMCGFYLNELLLKLLHRDDPHERLFAAYSETLQALGGNRDQGAVLRAFEKSLLKELGYAVTLDRDAETGQPIEARVRYTYLVERGPVRSANGADPRNGVELNGQTLLDMAADNYTDMVTMNEAKLLMRTLINHYLGDQILHSRQLLRDLQQL